MSFKTDDKYEKTVALSEALFDNLGMARAKQNQLFDLAYALDRVGQTQLADELAAIGDNLVTMARHLLDLYGAAQQADLNQQRAFTGDILRAFLIVNDADEETKNDLEIRVIRPLTGEDADV